MKPFKVKLPQIEEEIDFTNPPDDLEKIVSEAFARYTEGTATEYQYEDKLMYLDAVRDDIYKRVYGYDDDEVVKNEVLDYCEYELYDQGKLPENEEIFDLNFMAGIYAKGFRGFRFQNKHMTKREIEQINKTTLRIITSIVNAVVE